MEYQVMPDLTPLEYAALKADIANAGAVLVAVELDEVGAILDGHHRVRAWEELRQDGQDLPDYPRVVRRGLSEQQKRAHAYRLNTHRRHLTREQRDEVMRQMRADGMTYQEIASAVGVSHPTVMAATRDVNVNSYIENARGQIRPASYNRQTDDEHTFQSSIPIQVEDADADANADDTADESPAVFNVEDQWQHVETVATSPSMKVHYSSETPEHYTPDVIIGATCAVMGGIDLDPCSNSHESPHVPAGQYYTAADDGLAQYWSGRVYMNPPYGREIGAWVAKLVESYTNGDVSEWVALVPGRVDTEWWQRLTAASVFVCFVDGRLTFVGNDAPAPFPSAVVYAGENFDKFYYTFAELGPIWKLVDPQLDFGA